MRYILRSLTVIILGLCSATAMAQQVPMYSQYVMNGFLINPSFAGRDGYTSVNLTVREQWVGMSGAPGTFAASFQTRVLRNSYISKSTAVKKKIVQPTRSGRVGVGGYVFNDENGAMRRTGIQAAYAYHIPLGTTSGYPNDFALGLSFSAYQFAVNTNGMIIDPDDPLLNSYDRRVFIPDFNFGASFTTARYYAGIAMTNLFRGSLFFSSDTASNNRTELGNFFITGGMKVPVAVNWTLEPSGYIKASDMLFKSIQMDLSARMFYKENYWAGLSFRTANAFIVMAGLRYDRFYFAYASDFALTDIRKANTLGTHEITLAVKFGESARRYKWILPF
ncbi:MAG TPA: type IX secretion system membrane protein PorP/SprF [Bacteroidales bacterium]|jgi:type IX secretion system PorP/SprF family membrane protein|nr:type IX secretion system membrane protein PorP/SprF [Bacteroidales bacterium]